MARKIIVVDEGRCGAPVGEALEVGADRAARWINRGWARDASPAPESSSPDSGSEDGADAAPKTKTKKERLVAEYRERFDKDPAEALDKVTVKTLEAALAAGEE